MPGNNWFGSLFARSHASAPRGRQSQLAIELLEQRESPRVRTHVLEPLRGSSTLHPHEFWLGTGHRTGRDCRQQRENQNGQDGSGRPCHQLTWVSSSESSTA